LSMRVRGRSQWPIATGGRCLVVSVTSVASSSAGMYANVATVPTRRRVMLDDKRPPAILGTRKNPPPCSTIPHPRPPSSTPNSPLKIMVSPVRFWASPPEKACTVSSARAAAGFPTAPLPTKRCRTPIRIVVCSADASLVPQLGCRRDRRGRARCLRRRGADPLQERLLSRTVDWPIDV